MYELNDTIVAIATPAGMGGLGIVRLSGGNALVMARQLFVSLPSPTLPAADAFREIQESGDRRSAG